MKANKPKAEKLFEIGQLAMGKGPISGTFLVLDVEYLGDWKRKGYRYWCLHQRSGEKLWLGNNLVQPIEETDND